MKYNVLNASRSIPSRCIDTVLLCVQMFNQKGSLGKCYLKVNT